MAVNRRFALLQHDHGYKGSFVYGGVDTLPHGWERSTGSQTHRITHNLGHRDYNVQVTPTALSHVTVSVSKRDNYFTVQMRAASDAAYATTVNFDFQVMEYGS